MDTCTDHRGETERSLFCGACRKVLDPEALMTIRMKGFTGPASTNPNIEYFWETGDPSVFDRKPR